MVFKQLVRTAVPLLIFLFGIGLMACNQQAEAPTTETEAEATEPDKKPDGLQHPDWSKSAVIYEVNIRQFSEKGDFASVEEQLPRLQELGVDLLWLMPIHPIGELNRKGGRGSYYSVKDYRAVNPEFGTMEDFKRLVKKAHERDMHVIIDWVANHTAWDNPLTKEHPEWYTKDSAGNFQPPVPDWSDVIDLDFEQPGLRQYMIESMQFWVEEADIDGFRCDVAMMVPTDFWNEARIALEEVKPVFMLAEAEQPDLHERAFDMGYGWELHHLTNQIAKGEAGLEVLDSYLLKTDSVYGREVMHMNFTSNHDENSWNGTVQERMGDFKEVMAVLTYTFPGMPLIYSGQEAGMDKRLAFFEKDQIEWKEDPMADLYQRLNAIKKKQAVLHNGPWGGSIKRLPTSADEALYAFQRSNGKEQLTVVLNLSGEQQQVDPAELQLSGEVNDLLTDLQGSMEAGKPILVEPFGAHIFDN